MIKKALKKKEKDRKYPCITLKEMNDYISIINHHFSDTHPEKVGRFEEIIKDIQSYQDNNSDESKKCLNKIAALGWLRELLYGHKRDSFIPILHNRCSSYNSKKMKDAKIEVID